MSPQQQQTISILNEILILSNQSRMFALMKLQYLRPCDPNSIKQIEEFRQMESRATDKIAKVAGCITWLNSLELETEKI